MPPIITMQHITKVYDNGVIANNDVFFTLEKGSIHAIMGENGAGKSTLMKILFGLEQPTEGRITIDGDVLQITNPKIAITHGIGMVPQHFTQVPSLTVLENIILGIEPTVAGFINQKKALAFVEELIARYHFQLNPKAILQNLSIAQKQKVEILKALARDVRVLILDEPTSVLTPQETEELFMQLKKLKERGCSIVFISHKLREVKQITDTMSIMRHGRLLLTEKTEAVSIDEMAKKMVGRDEIIAIEKKQKSPKEAIMHMRNVSLIKEGIAKLNTVSLSVRMGEIISMAGVAGNGQKEIMECLWGRTRPTTGTITLEVNGQSIAMENESITARRKYGISYVPEDRISEGIAGESTIASNLIANRYKEKVFSAHGMLKKKAIVSYGQAMIKKFHVVCASANEYIKNLSGGNIQKVVIAREVKSSTTLLLLSEPSQGVDIGATSFIHQKIMEKRNSNTAILILTSDLNEILELSDKIIVMHAGEIVAYIEDPKTITEKELGLYMLGLKKQSAVEISKAYHGK